MKITVNDSFCLKLTLTALFRMVYVGDKKSN